MLFIRPETRLTITYGVSFIMNGLCKVVELKGEGMSSIGLPRRVITIQEIEKVRVNTFHHCIFLG